MHKPHLCACVVTAAAATPAGTPQHSGALAMNSLCGESIFWVCICGERGVEGVEGEGTGLP